jgi:hypothetical protein
MNKVTKIVEVVESRKTATFGAMMMAWNHAKPTIP